MAFVEWKSSYSVGLLDIDQQHRKLLEIINNLHDAMKEGNDRARLIRVVNELVEYTRFHFGFEEKMLERVGYPESTEHRRRHGAMVGRVEQFRDEVVASGATFSMKLMEFLKYWLSKHIMETDMMYARFIVAKNSEAGAGTNRLTA